MVFPPKADPPPEDIHSKKTDNVGKRLKEHNRGKTKSTKAYKPFIIAYTETFSDKTTARKREIFLKKNYKAREIILGNL